MRLQRKPTFDDGKLNSFLQCIYTAIGVVLLFKCVCAQRWKSTTFLLGMAMGAVSNILLDRLFIFPLSMGVQGAAIASGLGQGISLLILSTHFLRKQGTLRICRFSLSGALIGKIMQRGIPNFLTRLATPFSTLCYNLIIMRLMGDMGVSAFAIIGCISSISLGIFIGVSSGIQPLIGQSAYCLMGNHVHLLFQEKNAGQVSQIMKRLLSRYVGCTTANTPVN